MSEKAPAAPAKELSRREQFAAGKVKFEAEQAAADRQEFEAELYGDAGTTDFSDEAGQRIDEADAYAAHLERMASPDYVSTTWGGVARETRDENGRWETRTNIDSVPNEAHDRAVAERDAEISERLSNPELPEAYEQQLADKLLNPELHGVKKIKDMIGKAATVAVNGLETAYHANLDVKSMIKADKLHVRLDRSTRRQERLERREKKALFKWRRESLARKLAEQNKVVARRTKAYNDHMEEERSRHERRAHARQERQGAYEARHSDYLEHAEAATRRKMNRRHRSLERYRRVGEYMGASPEQLLLLQKRKTIISDAIMEAHMRKIKKEELGLAA